MTTHRKHHFYSHLVPLEPYIVILDQVELSDEEKTHLVTIIQSNLHYMIVDVVLSHLSSDDKKTFLHLAQNNNHDKTWEFLHKKTSELDEKIQKAAEELKKEMINDILEVRERKK